MKRALTRQGVRDLDGPRNGKRPHVCHHEWRHARDCAGCWGEKFGGYDECRHEYACAKCSATEWR